MGEGGAVGEGEVRVWLIAGPTASGKSALAMALAERLGGEIVNADAQQVYADLRVLTARPSPEEVARAPHHLYGVADAAQAWSVGRWAREAVAVLADIAGRGRTAIVVGGTGMYLRALTHGLADIPPVPAAIRAAVQARFDAEGEAAFRLRLSTLDPEAETRIEAGDRQRLVRAMAVAEASDRPLSDWRARTRPMLAAGAWRGVVIEPARDALYARCDRRLDAMLETDVLDEVGRLASRGLDPALPAMKAVGYRELAAYLTGETSLDEAADLARRETRRYAKRQSTWFRNQTPDWPRFADADAALAYWPQLAGRRRAVSP